MAASLACSSTHMRHNVPVARLSRTSAQSAFSSALHLRKQMASNHSFSLKLARRQISASRFVRASADGDNVSELASEKAVESGKGVADDSSKLASGQQSSAALDAKVEDASDSASYSSEVREKVVDVASDMAVDPADVDDLAKKDAKPLAQQSGRSVDDTVEALESKAGEVSDREGRKET